MAELLLGDCEVIVVRVAAQEFMLSADVLRLHLQHDQMVLVVNILKVKSDLSHLMLSAHQRFCHTSPPAAVQLAQSQLLHTAEQALLIPFQNYDA